MGLGKTQSRVDAFLTGLGFNTEEVVPWRIGYFGFALYGHVNVPGYETEFFEDEALESAYSLTGKKSRITFVYWPRFVDEAARAAYRADAAEFVNKAIVGLV